MSAPPETDREYAYFRAVGTDSPDIISKVLGLEPSESWSVGETFERRGNTFTRRSSLWQLDSGLTDQSPLNEHLSSLLAHLEPRRNELLRIGEKSKTQLVCVGYYFQSFSFELDFEIQKRATSLGLGFWFDTYSFGDYHEEITELREQVSPDHGRQRARGAAHVVCDAAEFRHAAERAQQLFAHGLHIGAGLAKFGFNLRRNGQRPDMGGAGQLVEIL